MTNSKSEMKPEDNDVDDEDDVGDDDDDCDDDDDDGNVDDRDEDAESARAQYVSVAFSQKALPWPHTKNFMAP